MADRGAAYDDDEVVRALTHDFEARRAAEADVANSAALKQRAANLNAAAAPFFPAAAAAAAGPRKNTPAEQAALAERLAEIERRSFNMQSDRAMDADWADAVQRAREIRSGRKEYNWDIGMMPGATRTVGEGENARTVGANMANYGRLGLVPDAAMGTRKESRPLTKGQQAAKAKAEAAAKGRKKIKDGVKATMKQLYPTKEFGRLTVPYQRYTAPGQAAFGLNAATADDQQLVNRAMYGFSGDGEYFRGNGMYQAIPGGVGMRHTGRFSGEGGFFDDLGNFFVKAGKTVLPVLRDVGRVAAPVLGNAILPGMGGMLGGAVANAVLGEGEYEMNGGDPFIAQEPVIKYNNLINSGSIQTKATAVIESAGDETGDLIFTHNEYIHDLTSNSLDFHTLERFEINPGVFQSFPLLSQFAQHFEEYDFIQCIFEFKSLVTDGNATAAGSVMLSPNYNASNPNLPDKRAIENASGSVSGKVTSSLFCGIECANDKTAYGGIKYIRTVDIDSAGRRMYDLGFLQIAAQGVPAGLAIGELWCRYKVRLSKMKVGALKIPALGSGFSLTSTSGAGSEYFVNTPAFNHTLTNPVFPVGAQLLAGDDISSVALTDPAAGDAMNARLLSASFAVVGGSQIIVTCKYSECWGPDAKGLSPSNRMYAGIDWAASPTDCTIPFTSTKSTTMLEIADPNGSTVMLRDVTTTFVIVFGTPGQIGKMNLRVVTSINSLTQHIPSSDVTCSNFTMEAIRTA